MATYFVASGGSNTAPYDTWAKAATSLQTALTAASSTGDIVVIQYNAVPSTDLESASSLTYTFSANITVMAASNDGGSAYTYQAMGDPSFVNWLGNSTQNRIPNINYNGVLRLRGITFRCAGTSFVAMFFGSVAGGWGSRPQGYRSIRLSPSRARRHDEPAAGA